RQRPRASRRCRSMRCWGDMRSSVRGTRSSSCHVIRAEYRTMRSGRRIGVAVGVLVVLAAAVGGVWWYQLTRAAPGQGKQEVTAIVSNGNDRGPGSLREALFVVASAKEPATISIQASHIALETVLPPIVTT